MIATLNHRISLTRAEDGLVEAARRGDRQAFGRLVAAEWPGCVRLARAILASDLDAEDEVQEAVISAWRRLHQLREDGRFSAWLRRAVARRCVRRARIRRWLRLDEIAEPESPGDATSTAGLEARRLLLALAPRQRAVLVLGEIDGLCDAEIAEALGIAPATVRVLRHQARRRLREIQGAAR